MALSYNSVTSGAAGGEDFTLNVGTSGYTKADLGKNFGEGNYICTSSLSDATLDIYFLNEDGSVAGYSNAAAATTTVIASKSFRYVVVYGSTSNDTLTFQYKTVISPTSNSTEDLTIGPRITNVATVSLPNQNDTTVVSGHNFATNITATFTGTDDIERNAKSIVRSSSTSLILTRPDDMPTSANPYTLTLTNPGTQSPTSSNSHKSINTISAGNSPVWVTTSPLHYDFSVSWNGGNLSATDADGGSSVTYSIVSGSLPTGITMSSSGVLSGTPSSSQVSATIRATDSGGNFVDRTFLFNRKPVWNTSSLPNATQGSAYSQTLSASDDTSISSYTLVAGTLPSGLSLNTSSGLISGTPTNGNGNSTLTFRATDSNGGTNDRNLSIGVLLAQNFTSTSSWTAPSGVSSVEALVVAGGGGGGAGSYGGHGGGGAGGVIYNSSLAVTPGSTYTITIGGGGGVQQSGNNSSIGSLIVATGGGRGGGNSTNNNNTGGPTAASGGSGGGGGGDSGAGSASSGSFRNAGSGTAGQGNSGGQNSGFQGGGGGGKGSAGSGATYGSGSSYTITGVTYNVGGGGHGGTNGGTVANSTWGGGGINGSNGTAGSGASNTGGGGGAKNGNHSSAGSGGSGRVVLSYVA